MPNIVANQRKEYRGGKVKNLVIRNMLVFSKRLQLYVGSQISSFDSHWKERKKEQTLEMVGKDKRQHSLLPDREA